MMRRILILFISAVIPFCSSCDEVKKETSCPIYSGTVNDSISEDRERELSTDEDNRDTISSEYDFELYEYLDLTDRILEVTNALKETVPELSDYEKFVSEKSEGRATIYTRVYLPGEFRLFLYRDNSNDYFEGEYYAVIVGEQHKTHFSNWNWFYVKSDLSEVLWVDIVTLEVKSLDKWRNSEFYINLSEYS